MPFNIDIIGIGRGEGDFSQSINRYVKAMKPYTSLTVTRLKPQRGDPVSVVEKEGELMLKKARPNRPIIGLSEEGRCMDSVAFSSFLDTGLMQNRSVTFIIGGAYGLSDTVKNACQEILSLSKMTFPHQLALLLLIEQIYRASTIVTNHPYHKQ